jgi:hypothetical protein
MIYIYGFPSFLAFSPLHCQPTAIFYHYTHYFQTFIIVSTMKPVAFTSLLLPILLAPTIASQLINEYQDNSLPQPAALSSTPSRKNILEGSKSSPGQTNLICTTPGSCFDDCGSYHSGCTKDLDPSYHFCNNIGDEWTCSQRPEAQTPSATSLPPSSIFSIPASTPLGLLRQRSLGHLYEGNFEDNHIEDETQPEAEPEPTIFANITKQVKRDSCAGTGANNYSNTCCGPQEDNCCTNVHGNCAAYELCECKWAFPNNCWCLWPSAGSFLQPPSIFTIPGHILCSTLLTLSNTIPTLARQPDDKRNLKRGTSDANCGADHVVCFAGYHCKNDGKDNYACSGTSSLRPPRIFFILSLPFQIILSMFGSIKTIV